MIIPVAMRTISRCHASLLLAASLLLSACTTAPIKTVPNAPEKKVQPAQEIDALSALIARQDRIYRVAAPLMVKNAPLCRSFARPLLGFTAKNLYSYPAELAPAAESALKLDERLRVMQVLDGSGAMRAGIRAGDILQSIQDQPLPLGAQAETEAARLLAPLIKNATDISVVVLRQERPIKLTIPLTAACAFSMEIGQTPQVSAYADGRRIMITRGMLDFLSSDEELAVILAREIAHNVLQHAASQQLTATVASMIDALLPLKPDPAALASRGGLRPMSAKADQEADRLAMYLLARAGYDPAATERVIGKIAQAYPASQNPTYTALHPWTPERRQSIQSILSEIRQKQTSKNPLLP
jgi:Zn-dependent protease with chaperone function